MSSLGEGATSIEEVKSKDISEKFDFYIISKYKDGKEVHYFSKTVGDMTKKMHFKIDSSQVNNETLAEIKAIAGSIK